MISSVNLLYVGALLVYVCGWCVTLGGLSAAQHYCEDNTDYFSMFESAGLLSPLVGKSCHKLFRFPWWILFAGLLPLVAEGIAQMKPVKTRRFGTAAAIFAVIAVLNIIMANMFFNFVQGAHSVATGKLEDRLKVCVSGWSITAGLALFLILLAPVCADADEGPDMKSFTTITDPKPAQTSV